MQIVNQTIIFTFPNPILQLQVLKDTLDLCACDIILYSTLFLLFKLSPVIVDRQLQRHSALAMQASRCKRCGCLES